MKKGIKIGLITTASILVAGILRADFTKLGYIPNRFDIEALCPKKNHIILEGYNDYPHNDINYGGNNDYPYNDTDYKCPEGYSTKEMTFSTRNDTLSGIFCCNDKGQCFSPPITENRSMIKVDKPIIYLYPVVGTGITVKLGNPGNLSHTYPKYNASKGRNVIAQPNGDLEDIRTGRKLYALYREGITNNKPEITEGFVVKGKDTISFLEEKLSILGLNEREAEEFIVYWLPQMENNPYNLIRFETIQEQNKAMPLNINPTPDTIIRVMMDWKPINGPIDIPEQKLITPERNGFVVVERGGSKIN